MARNGFGEKPLIEGRERHAAWIEWEGLRSTHSAPPEKIEMCFLNCVIETVEQFGAASRGEVSSRLMHGDPKLFNSQKVVDEVEKQLLQKHILRKFMSPFVSDYCLMYDEDFVKSIKAGFPKSDDSIEFVEGIPNSGIIFEMQSRLTVLTKYDYPDISPQESKILEKIVFSMLDNRWFAIAPNDVIYDTILSYGDPLFNTREEIQATIDQLIHKKILHSVYAGYELLDDDNKTISRGMPTPHIMLDLKFASKAISLLNFTYMEEKRSQDIWKFQKRSKYLVQ